MKTLAIYGSPNKLGNSALIVDSILESIGSNSRSERIYLYDINYEDCIGCSNADNIHKKQFCIFNDDFTNHIIAKIKNADLIIISSPIYIGHITGKLKTFLDRWYTFVKEDFSIRILKNKKFITITTSAAPADRFRKVNDYLNYWLSEFFKMEKVYSIHVGELMESGKIEKGSTAFSEAVKIVNKLKEKE